MRKNIIKSVLATLLVTCGAMTALGETAAHDAVVMHMTDGKEMAFALSSRPKVEFTNDRESIMITIAEEEIQVEVSDVKMFTYGFLAETSVETMNVRPEFRISAGTLECFGLPEGSEIIICSMDGKTRYVGSAANSVDISGYQNGTYLVRTACGSFKILKK